jgi:hypothetical protein
MINSTALIGIYQQSVDDPTRPYSDIALVSIGAFPSGLSAMDYCNVDAPDGSLAIIRYAFSTLYLFSYLPSSNA